MPYCLGIDSETNGAGQAEVRARLALDYKLAVTDTAARRQRDVTPVLSSLIMQHSYKKGAFIRYEGQAFGAKSEVDLLRTRDAIRTESRSLEADDFRDIVPYGQECYDLMVEVIEHLVDHECTRCQLYELYMGLLDQKEPKKSAFIHTGLIRPVDRLLSRMHSVDRVKLGGVFQSVWQRMAARGFSYICVGRPAVESQQG